MGPRSARQPAEQGEPLGHCRQPCDVDPSRPDTTSATRASRPGGSTSPSGTVGARRRGRRRLPLRGSRRGRGPLRSGSARSDGSRPASGPAAPPGRVVVTRSTPPSGRRGPRGRRIICRPYVSVNSWAVSVASKRRSSVPSSATSPTVRSLDSGTVGGLRLANAIVRRSGREPRARAQCSARQARRRRGGSRRRSARRPTTAMAGSSPTKSRPRTRVSSRRSRPRPGTGGRRSEGRVMLSTGRDEVVEQRDPVAIVGIEPVPERPHPGPAREVGEECRLAVTRVGEDQDDPTVDLGAQPVQQPRSLERLIAERGTLHLRDLDRITADLRRSGGHSWTGSPRPCGPDLRESAERLTNLRDARRGSGGANDIDRSRAVSTEPSEGRSGMGAMVASGAQPTISCGLSPRIRSRS